jgi:hypothetical protein
MVQIIFLLLLVTGLVILSFQRWLLDALIEAINNFRGGPPTPMHPSPSNDSVLLLRRRKKVQD